MNSPAFTPQNYTFECLICMETVSLSQSLTLSCDHRFCRNCLIADWDAKIKQGYVSRDQLKCLNEGCITPATNYELQANLAKEVYDQYLRKTIENYKGGDEDIEILVHCRQCETPFFIFSGASYFTCRTCGIRFCVNCNGNMTEHEGITCQEFEEKKMIPEEYNLKQALLKEGLMKCPHCQEYGLKVDGCNFIYCGSGKCGKKKMYCYLCGIPLEETDHYTHFLGDPYGHKKMTCLTIEDRIKKGVKLGPLNQKAAVEKLNEIGCPNCGTKNVNECEIFENFSNLICFCKKCGSKYFCIKCKKNIHEAEVFDHFLMENAN